MNDVIVDIVYREDDPPSSELVLCDSVTSKAYDHASKIDVVVRVSGTTNTITTTVYKDGIKIGTLTETLEEVLDRVSRAGYSQFEQLYGIGARPEEFDHDDD